MKTALLSLLSLLSLSSLPAQQFALDYRAGTTGIFSQKTFSTGTNKLLGTLNGSDPVTITLGTGLSLSGSTLNASGGGGGSGLDNIASTITGATLTLSGTLTTGRTLTVRDLAGTIALTSDLSAYLTTSSAASTYQPLDADLTSIAALTTTTFGRSLLTQADASAARSTLGLGTLATQSATISDYLTTAAAATTYQPLDADLTSIAALTTTTFGRSLLTQADASAARSTLGLGTLATQSATISDYLTTATAASTYQPLDADLTSIAALTTTTFGRSLLTAADASQAASLLQLDSSSMPSFASLVLARSDNEAATLVMAATFPQSGDVVVSTQNVSGSREHNLPNASGTYALTSNTDGTLANASVTNAMLAGSIAASKLVGTDISTVGTITTGTWNATTIGIARGGTGATTASAARIALLPSMTGNGGKFLRVNAGATDYELATISGGGDALTTSPLSQFAATTSAQFAGVISDETGTGAVVLASSPTLTTPNLGTPSAATLTNATGLPLSTGVTGSLPIANGGTGQTSQTNAFDALAPTTTKGDLIVSNGTDNIRVPVGATNGHVLTVDSAEASGVKWAAASGGGSGGNWVLISTTTISGNPSTLTFTFSGSYRKYRLELENVYCSSDGFILRMRTSTDGGSTFDSGASNYGYAYGASGTYGPVSTTGTYIETSSNMAGSATDEGLWGEIDFYDPLNASLKTFAKWQIFGRIYNSAASNIITGAGYRDSAADVDTVQLFFSSGNFGGGKIRLYGWSE